MAISFNCPNCGGALRVGESLAGARMKCPTCRAEVEVPQAVVAAPESAAPPRPVFVSPAAALVQREERPLDVTEISEAPAAGAVPPALPRPAAPVTTWPAAAGGLPLPDDRAAAKAAARQRLMAGSRLSDEEVAAAAGRFADAPPTHMPLQRRLILAGEVLRSTWKIYGRQPGVCILAVVFAQALPFCMQVAVRNSVPPRASAKIEVAGWIVSAALAFAVAVWLELGLAHLLLRVARGEPAHFRDLFDAGGAWPRGMAAGLLLFLGMTLLSVPIALVGGLAALATQNPTATAIAVGTAAWLSAAAVIVLLLAFSQTAFLLVDRNAKALPALKESARLTRGNRGQLFVLALATGLYNAVGLVLCGAGAGIAVALFGGGRPPPPALFNLGLTFVAAVAVLLGILLVAIAVPFGRLAFAVAYLRLSGQPTAGER